MRSPHHLIPPTIYDPGPMRLLLPPSETKLSGGSGPPLRLANLGFPELNPTRDLVASQLVALTRDPPECRRILGLSKQQDAEIARNAELLTSATMPAIERYTGVLYDAIDVSRLSAAARRRATRSIIIASALFGAVRADDLVPAYRLSAGSPLPGTGPLAALWRTRLTEALRADETVIDLRSAAYVNLAPLPDAVTVQVISADGRTVSHFNKAAKGRFVHAFLTATRVPTTLPTLIVAAANAGLTVRRLDRRSLQIVV